jgi:large conductance mechanosensitive channel
MNAMKRRQVAVPAAPAEPSKEVLLLTQIRDLLKR